MDVSSVSSNYSQATQVQRPESDQQAKQPVREHEQSPETEVQKAPVVNLQGQKTGQVVNTTA